MNQSSMSFLFLVLPLVLVPSVAVWGWNILPRPSSINNPSPPAPSVIVREGFFTICLVLVVVIFFVFYGGVADHFHLALLFASILCFWLVLVVVLALPPRTNISTGAASMFSMPDRNLRCQAFLFILISLITITCACFRSNIYWKQSAFQYEYDFEYYGAARITAQRYTDQQDDDDNAQADDDNNNEAHTDLWTSVEWMCPNYDDGGTLCQQELASICPDDNTAMTRYQKWMYINYLQVRVYNADGVVEECDTNLMDLISNDDDAYDSTVSPQNDGSPYLYVVANCTGGCSAQFAGGKIQSDYKEARLALRAGYVCLGLSIVGLLGLVGMTVYKWRDQGSTNSDAGVELLPPAQGEVT